MIDQAYRGLPTTAARLHRMLGRHPGAEWELGVAATALGTSIARARAQLLLLVGAGLLTGVGGHRYRVAPSVSQHARDLAVIEDSPEERTGALERMLEYYRRRLLAADLVVTPHRRRLPYTAACEVDSVGFPDDPSALAWLERERATLIAAARTAHSRGLHHVGWHLCDGLWPS
jgi:anaerobic selenocysteine-containing dehydrogenase